MALGGLCVHFCKCYGMVRTTIDQTVDRYLALVDGLLPGVVSGFYLVGSVALGAHRPARSDIDFVAVVSGQVGRYHLRRLRMAQVRTGMWTVSKAVRQRRPLLTGTLNGVFIRQSDIDKPVSEIVPVASQVGERFSGSRGGSDVSPVAWKVLAESGIPLRGPKTETLGLNPQPDLLRSWTAGNLESYWRQWAVTLMSHPARRFAMRPRWSTAQGVLGVSRLHCTITTGDVVSKEDAGKYALAKFARQWHPLISEALAYWREEPDRLEMSAVRRATLTAGFVTEVIDDGVRWFGDLAGASPK
jgi:Domain of unknown function (DUF4111)/Nucleotidyltransferase domain